MSVYSDTLSFLVPMIGGGVLLTTASLKSKKLAVLKEKGIPAKGIVFEMEQESGGIKVRFGENDGPDSTTKYPVIRFLTAEKEWITARSSHAVHSLYKEGEAVTVFYNKADPTDFMIESRLNNIIYPLLQALGILLILAG